MFIDFDRFWSSIGIIDVLRPDIYKLKEIEPWAKFLVKSVFDPTSPCEPTGQHLTPIIVKRKNCLPQGCLIRNYVQWCFLPPETFPESDGIPQGFESSGLGQNSSLSGLSQFCLLFLFFLHANVLLLWMFCCDFFPVTYFFGCFALIHRMQIWRTTRSAPGTSRMKARLVRLWCFVLTMLLQRSLDLVLLFRPVYSFLCSWMPPQESKIFHSRESVLFFSYLVRL